MTPREFIGLVIDKWPGKRLFGVYRFLPFFFVLGASVEFSMIKWSVGEINFYSVFKRKQAEKKLRQEATALQDFDQVVDRERQKYQAEKTELQERLKSKDNVPTDGQPS